MEQEMVLYIGVGGIVYLLVVLILIARISHWSSLACEKLDETNRLLRGERQPPADAPDAARPPSAR